MSKAVFQAVAIAAGRLDIDKEFGERCACLASRLPDRGPGKAAGSRDGGVSFDLLKAMSKLKSPAEQAGKHSEIKHQAHARLGGRQWIGR
jgi:hypothetical protein